MAVHARLSAPQPPAPREWPWHRVEWRPFPAHVLWTGDRRMEAETYLSSGYGLRIALQARCVGWRPLKQLARVWQPSRLKGILVSPEHGTPFLAATQVFDIKPVPRKWLALERTENAHERFVKAGTILVTCSGAVGRATIAREAHERLLISHDLLRVELDDQSMWGWVYAYLRSPQGRALMSSAQYGHIIKHLETAHLDALPVPIVRAQVADTYKRRAQEILDDRNQAHKLLIKAEELFERSVGPLKMEDWGDGGFIVRASACFFGGRRRFEAARHTPRVAAIYGHLRRKAVGFMSLAQAGARVWVPGRYKRIPAADGVAYYDSADLIEISPEVTKRLADCGFGDDSRGRVRSGWLLMPCSGQVYGIIGSVVLAGEALDNQVVSNHVLRIVPAPDSGIRSGYLATVLGHPGFGRPLVRSLAFGSSVPELDADDISALEIVRIPRREEDAVADCAEEAALKRTRADVAEARLAVDAGQLIDRFLAGDSREFVT